MKTDQFLYALIGGGIVALAWLVAHLGSSVPFEMVIGYGSIVAIVALAAIDYRIRVKKLFR